MARSRWPSRARKARSSAWPWRRTARSTPAPGRAARSSASSPTARRRSICDTPENYVWSLALDPKGQTLYAGTGPKGRIYQVTPDGKAERLYTTKQDHVLCVAAGPDGSLYAGTDKGGVVYRIDGKGKGFVLYQAPQAEVRSLLVTADGVYAGTSAPTKRTVAPGSVPAAATASLPAGTTTEDRRRATSASTKDKEAEKSDSGRGPLDARLGRELGLSHRQRRQRARGLPRESADAEPRCGTTVGCSVGTGMDGQLFEVNEATRERSEIARLDHGQILCLCRRHDGSIVRRHRRPRQAVRSRRTSFAAKGTVVSEVLDAKLVSKWGSLRWQADAPAGTGVSVAVRSGNVAEPDETWSDWSAEQTDAEQAHDRRPAGSLPAVSRDADDEQRSA